jgi:GNAT superfamily N-acetyltransferase
MRKMLHTLEVGEYEKVRPIFRDMGHHLILESVITGLTRAAVYVDNLEQPQAVLCRYKDRFYLAGDPTPAFTDAMKALFDDAVYPQGRAEGREAFVLYYVGERWEAAIQAVLDGHRPQQYQRSYFELTSLSNDAGSALPPGMVVHAIDKALLAQTHLQGLDELVEEIQSERDSVDDFLSKSFGVCAVVGDSIAGLCTSEFNTGTRCEVGIMTMEAHQRQGVATALGRALAGKAFSRGITQIGWHCWTRNTPSVATALKIGFRHVLDYAAYVGWYAPRV